MMKKKKMECAWRSLRRCVRADAAGQVGTAARVRADHGSSAVPSAPVATALLRRGAYRWCVRAVLLLTQLRREGARRDVWAPWCFYLLQRSPVQSVYLSVRATSPPSSAPSFGCSRLGSPQRIICVLIFLSPASTSVPLTTCTPAYVLPHLIATPPLHLLFGLPLFLVPGGSILCILLLIYPPLRCSMQCSETERSEGQ